MPALDGLRGTFVVAVVAYHSGIESVSGGFLGVSAFFTLSGFLISSQLLVEADEGPLLARTLRFWKRRLVRLAPASALVVAAVVLLASSSPLLGEGHVTRSDALAGLLQFHNWWTIDQGSQYGAQFAESSALVHFWSLSVEEQFYLAFPLVAAALALRARCGDGSSV